MRQVGTGWHSLWQGQLGYRRLWALCPYPGETSLEHPSVNIPLSVKLRSEEMGRLEDVTLSWYNQEAWGPERGMEGRKTHSKCVTEPGWTFYPFPPSTCGSTV